MEFDDSRINYSEENEYTYIIGYDFLCLIVHVENIIPPVLVIDKFNVVFFRKPENVDFNILGLELYLKFFLLSPLQITFNHTFGVQIILQK